MGAIVDLRREKALERLAERKDDLNTSKRLFRDSIKECISLGVPYRKIAKVARVTTQTVININKDITKGVYER
jgi:DNA invertase Pin-like site-specific DNA recombinase